ncbi:hypothetical protein UA08_06439 [Talaromyces atroroseus]|uniref:NAD-dependent epimerase/dehydratase domain-containing protein n=1 Tax=Talaromyces atroroseus TaxID=1441469 RepID=A0A225AV34_TALAT|nr:hypothetical protein UA08_06439 [Talaromyces atroroseus]OKL58295.1 hypothetical protein UA08_06439 [Talaromyces atroroseus]
MASKEHLILLTGASGFVGGHILHSLLAEGYNVRCTVRSESSAASIRNTHSASSNQLSFATVTDFTHPDAFDDAVQGVSGIIHTASPFLLQSNDHENDLVKPAIQGTVHLLQAAYKHAGPQLYRVIVTSSFAAILDMEKGYRPGYTYTDTDWNPASYEQAVSNSSTAFAYCASKKLAEKAAWDFVESTSPKPSFALTTMCPPWILGPNIDANISLSHLNESTQTIYQLINGSLSTPPPTDFAGFADVRDVAEAHLKAYQNPEAAGQRFLISRGNFNYQTACDIIRESFPQLASEGKVPEGTPGAGEKEAVYRVDSSKSTAVLGIEYTPLKQTLKDCVSQLLAASA